MYRSALAIRHKEAGLGDGPMNWIDSEPSVLAFSRPGNFACYLNFGDPVDLPAGSEVLLSSGALIGATLPKDTAVWLRLSK